jgi:hypothetical protein
VFTAFRRLNLMPYVAYFLDRSWDDNTDSEFVPSDDGAWLLRACGALYGEVARKKRRQF